MLHPEQWTAIDKNVAYGAAAEAARPATTQIPTASRRLRAPSMTPDSAKAMVAITSTVIWVCDKAQGTVFAMPSEVTRLRQVRG